MPHAINPTTPTQGLASRDQDDGPVELNDRHLRSHGKIGDCEQSTFLLTVLSPLILSLFTQSFIHDHSSLIHSPTCSLTCLSIQYSTDSFFPCIYSQMPWQQRSGRRKCRNMKSTSRIWKTNLKPSVKKCR